MITIFLLVNTIVIRPPQGGFFLQTSCSGKRKTPVQFTNCIKIDFWFRKLKLKSYLCNSKNRKNMPSLHDIRKPVQQSFLDFERVYAFATTNANPFVNAYLSELGNGGGKQLRPLLLLLSAGVFGYVSEKAVKLAAAMEILHNTSLVHDDVVDDANVRRGKKTLNVLENNKIAVLTGDYLFSQVLRLCAETGDMHVVEQISHLSQHMGEGELIQQYVSRHDVLEVSEYYTVIEKKTAQFMSQCCRLGAYCSAADSESQETLARFGLAVGMAFQIKDDVLDYVGHRTGKSVGNDILEHKLTLPLLHVLHNAPQIVADAVKQRFAAPELTTADVDFIIQSVVENGGIDYSLQQTDHYGQKALKQLALLPQNACTQSLAQIVQFVTNRNY